MSIEFDTLTSADRTSGGTKIQSLPDEVGFYGQTFTATSANLSTLEFAVDHASGGGAVELTVMIASIRFDSGGFHPDEIVYQSALITIDPDGTSGTGAIISVDTSGLTLVPGQQYVILFNSNSGDGPQGDGSLHFVSNPQDDAEYFVYNHTTNQDDVQAFDQNNWYQNPANGSGWGDVAIRLTYDTSVTLTFDAATNDYSEGIYTSFSEDGFTLTSSPGGHMSQWPEDSANDNIDGNNLSAWITPQTITLTRDDGTTFAINSIDLAEIYDDPNSSVPEITFIGYKADGTTVTVSAVLDRVDGVQTFTFPSTFIDLVKVEISQGYESWGWYQFDNIVLNGDFADAQNEAPTVSGPVASTALEDASGYSVDLLDGASDPDSGDTLNVADLAVVSGDGSGITSSSNSLTVDPSAYNHLAVGESEVVSYSYNVVDGNGGTVAQTATVTITGANDGPSVSGAVSSTAGEDASGYSVDLLNGASDPDSSDTLNVADLAVVSGDASGIAASGNSLTVDPSAYNHLAVGESAVVSYSYNVVDGNGGTVAQTATVTITGANDGPTATSDVNSVNEDQSVTGNVLTGAGADSDADTSDVLRVVAIAAGAVAMTVASGSGAVIEGTWGTLTVHEDGSYSYAADNDELDLQPAGTPLTDTFTYTIDDGNGGSDTATLTITVNPTNDVDTQTGTKKADTLSGDRTAAGTEDTIYGGGGADVIDGMAGADSLYGGNGDDQIRGGDGIDEIYGDSGNDQLWGGNGRDLLRGGSGDDSLYGEAGDDVLIGGTGNDILEGGDGSDTFVFGPGEKTSGKSGPAAESDTITDFTIGEDILRLEGGVTVVSQTEQAGSTVLQLSNGGLVTLAGVTLAEWTDPSNDSVESFATADYFI